MKILIIGGGPAGSIAAKELSPFFDVTLIQYKKNFDKPCGGGIKTKLFEEFNLNKKLIKHSFSKIEMIYKNSLIPIDLKGKNLSIVNRKEFDAYLRKLAQIRGAKLFYGRLKKITKNRAFIEFNKELIPFEFDILIAADGVNSTTRKLLNLPPIPYTITHYGITSKYKTQTCKFFFDKELGGEFYGWAFPKENSTHIGSVKRENFLNLCKYLNINLKPKGYKIPTWEENIVIQHKNVYFVGDAAGQVMPLSFEGIYYAMHSAKILANAILDKKNYQNEWNKRFLKKFKFLKFVEKINKTPLKSILINSHKIPFIQNLSINMWLGEKNV